MSANSQSESKTISWNSVHLTVPATWEAKATGKQQLNFEDSFQAILEMRWQRSRAKDFSTLVNKALKQLEKHSGRKLRKIDPSVSQEFGFPGFSLACYASRKVTVPQVAFLYHHDSAIFLMLQFPHSDSPHHPLLDIRSMSCSSAENTEETWAIQDFHVEVPSNFELYHHTMDSGMTVLNFMHDKTHLHICRLAPASMRLKRTSLEEIMISLLGHVAPPGPLHVSNTELVYQQAPTIVKQLLLRLKRKRPFRLAKMWHDVASDRILGVFLEALHPIDMNLHTMICSSYLIEKKNSLQRQHHVE